MDGNRVEVKKQAKKPAVRVNAGGKSDGHSTSLSGLEE